MLVILYITSAVAGVLVSIFEYRREFKYQLISVAIAVLTGIVFSVSMLRRINIYNPNFGSVFGVLSLIAWHCAFLSNDVMNLVSYEFAFFIASSLFCFFCSSINYSDYLTSCSEKHISTEIVQIVTTVDGTELGESIYGDGFVIGLIAKENPNVRLYQYYFQSEDGNIKPEEIYVDRTKITYIDETISPYIEITYEANCMGYQNESKTHVFRGSYKTYHLYIHENSIQTNINTSE